MNGSQGKSIILKKLEQYGHFLEKIIRSGFDSVEQKTFTNVPKDKYKTIVSKRILESLLKIINIDIRIFCNTREAS